MLGFDKVPREEEKETWTGKLEISMKVGLETLKCNMVVGEGGSM